MIKEPRTISPAIRPARAVDKVWAETRVSSDRKPRTGRVVNNGVRISPTRAPTKPKVNAYCSMGKVVGVGLIFAREPMEVPQNVPRIANATIPTKRMIKSALIISPPDKLLMCKDKNNDCTTNMIITCQPREVKRGSG